MNKVAHHRTESDIVDKLRIVQHIATRGTSQAGTKQGKPDKPTRGLLMIMGWDGMRPHTNLP